MSRATISTGITDSMPPNKQEKPCHIVVLSDFSGREHRGLNDAANLSQRKIIELTRDNFDDVFQRMVVTFDTPISEAPITFYEPEDLHPDFIYERVDLFTKFRALKRKLKNPATFNDAAQEIQRWATDLSEKKQSPKPIDSEQENTLDFLLNSTRAQQEQAQSIQGMIQQIVAPYVIPSADPRLPELNKTVDDAVSHLMRKILHNSAFQNIESAWKSLHWLMRRLETNNQLRVFMADISLMEIIQDNETHEDSITQLHQLLADQRLTQGSIPFSMIVADYTLSDDLQHCEALANLGSVAADLKARLLIGGSERIAGCESLVAQPNPDQWQLRDNNHDDFNLLWHAIREQDYSEHISVLAPRFLLRLPYGSKTSPVEDFEFEELPKTEPHDYYLWGNSAFLMAALLAGPNAETNRIGNLPIHVYKTEYEHSVTPCAEVLMTDAVAHGLQQAGLIPVRSVANEDSVIINNLDASLKLS